MRKIGGRDRSEVRAGLLRSIALGIAYYLAARLSLELALVGEITPLWPPTGIALVGFLLFGTRVWPGVAIAALAVNLPISESAFAAFVTAVGNTAAPIVAAAMLRRIGFRPQLDRLRDALAIVVAALLSTTISATIGPPRCSRRARSPARSTSARGPCGGRGTRWGSGRRAGPADADHDPGAPDPRGWRVLEAIVLAAVLVVISSLIVATDLPVYFLLFPVLGWAAWRFRQPGATPPRLLVSVFATWAAAEARSVRGSTCRSRCSRSRRSTPRWP